MSSAADTNTTVHGYALKDPKGKFEPWTYHPRPLGDDDVEVKITHCGICASDIHTAFGGWGHVEYPIIVGHEIVGTASAVGKNVKHIKVGDRVGCGAQCGSCMNKEGKPCKGCPDNENQCSVHNIGTYNAKYNDGERSQGGYSDLKRFDARFAFHIPDNLPSDVAAPLLCAGATVYSPLARYGAGKGKKVGVVGIGGLGHLAVQFAAKLGAEVLAIGRSANKAEQAKKLGASEYITIDDKAATEKHWNSIDIMIITANGKDLPWEDYIALCKLDAQFCLVGLPEDELKIKPFTLVQNRPHITGSSIGSTKEIKEMLEFASKHDVKPWIERLPMSQVNEGIRKVNENDVKFRVVLEVGK